MSYRRIGSVLFLAVLVAVFASAASGNEKAPAKATEGKDVAIEAIDVFIEEQ